MEITEVVIKVMSPQRQTDLGIPATMLNPGKALDVIAGHHAAAAAGGPPRGPGGLQQGSQSFLFPTEADGRSAQLLT